MSLDRLAQVELQLVMQCCDLLALLTLARCSRFTLAAASHDFAWRSLSPLSFDSFSTALTDLVARLRGSRLLSHCDVALRWRNPAAGSDSIHPYATEAELVALESVPRLVALDARGKYLQSHDQMRRLVSHPAFGQLTVLHTSSGQMDGACMALLAAHQARLRSLTLHAPGPFDSPEDPRGLLAPLPRLRSLTDLALHSFETHLGAASLAGCTSLRRLRIADVSLQTLFAVLTAPALAQQLESLALDNVRGSHSDADGGHMAVKMWTAIFTSQRALRFLRLQGCDSARAALQGAAAAITTANAMRNLTALRVDTLRMDADDGSLLPLLATHCPQLRQLHMQRSGGHLVGLPLLVGLRDLSLHSLRRAADHVHVAQCASLRRLCLSDMEPEVLHAILCSPHLQRLETLTLQSLQDSRGQPGAAALDWSLCLANLRSLHTLHLQQFEYGGLLLAAIPAAAPAASSSLRRIRLHSPPLTGQIAEETMAAALRHLPPLVLETQAPFVGPEWSKLRGLFPHRALAVADPPLADPFSFWGD